MMVHVLVGVQLILDLLQVQIANVTVTSLHGIIEIMIRDNVSVLWLKLRDPVSLEHEIDATHESNHQPAHFGETGKPTLKLVC